MLTRAELLDVSVPRDDSLETAEQWTHTRSQIAADADGIPFPNGDYFIDEYVLMFREVLDKKSSSAHKLTKRLKRACLIAAVLAQELMATGQLDKRGQELAGKYPTFAEFLTGPNIPAANAVVFLRMCEQLVESYDLAYDEKLRADSGRMMQAFDRDLRRILTNELTHETFLELMQIYTHLGRTLYNHAFVLAQFRRNRIPDNKLIDAARQIAHGIGAEFNHDPKRIKCAVVEDFAIAAEPDLPVSLKQALPLNVLKIIAYTNVPDAERLTQITHAFARKISEELAPNEVDFVFENGVLYVRLNQQSNAMPVQDVRGASGKLGKAVFLKIEWVVDDNVDNWVAPSHERDLRAIVKQYRRSLPRYTEYYALAQKKNILQQMETALTTY
jgi:hypothetical protein